MGLNRVRVDSVAKLQKKKTMAELQEENEALKTKVSSLETNLDNTQEQEKQGKRLETLESRDGELWRKAVGYVVTAIIGAFLGYMFTQIGF